jgi:hypothetical protein
MRWLTFILLFLFGALLLFIGVYLSAFLETFKTGVILCLSCMGLQ